MGLVLTYKTSGIFNFAYGALAAAGALVFYFLRTEHGMPWPLAGAISVFVLGPIMGLIFQLITRRIAERRRGVADPCHRRRADRRRSARRHPVRREVQAFPTFLPRDVPRWRLERGLRPADHRAGGARRSRRAVRDLAVQPDGHRDPRCRRQSRTVVDARRESVEGAAVGMDPWVHAGLTVGCLDLAAPQRRRPLARVVGGTGVRSRCNRILRQLAARVRRWAGAGCGVCAGDQIHLERLVARRPACNVALRVLLVVLVAMPKGRLARESLVPATTFATFLAGADASPHHAGVVTVAVLATVPAGPALGWSPTRPSWFTSPCSCRSACWSNCRDRFRSDILPSPPSEPRALPISPIAASHGGWPRHRRLDRRACGCDRRDSRDPAVRRVPGPGNVRIRRRAAADVLSEEHHVRTDHQRDRPRRDPMWTGSPPHVGSTSWCWRAC